MPRWLLAYQGRRLAARWRDSRKNELRNGVVILENSFGDERRLEALRWDRGRNDERCRRRRRVKLFQFEAPLCQIEHVRFDMMTLLCMLLSLSLVPNRALRERCRPPEILDLHPRCFCCRCCRYELGGVGSQLARFEFGNEGVADANDFSQAAQREASGLKSTFEADAEGLSD